ncbi:MAG: hypothetical protein CML67_02130 [Rhodobacteraceae bacterium]|nr:hypothetical protein [Paracoccaceae bacterium]
MFVWWLEKMILCAPEDGSGGGGGDAAGGAGDPPANSGGEGDPPAEGGGEGGGEGNEGGSEIYRPDGLLENLLGSNDRETIDKLHDALKGYRKRDTERGAPEDASAYASFGEDVPEELAPHLKGLSEDTAFQRVSKTAHELGVPVKDFQRLTTELYAAAQEMGALEPFLDVEAERAALTPEDARHLPEAEQRQARERRMQENEAFLDQLAQREDGKVDKSVFEYVKTELGDSAKGHQFIEYMRHQMGGDTSDEPMGGGSSGGNNAREDLARRAALPENTPGNPKFDKASYDQLQKAYQDVVK